MENFENKIEILEPVFKENYTAIAMSSSDEYIPYLSVCLQSLVEHTSPQHNYDIIIFSTSENKTNINTIISNYSKTNISIRFFNPKEILKNLKMTITHSYFNEACYYRIVAPVVMPNYNKLIFTDIDLIFNTDIQKLAQTNIETYPLAACQESIWKTLIEKDEIIHHKKIRDYAKNVLKLNDVNIYYNTGVILINIQEYNKNNYYGQLKEVINNNYFLYQEQDALNYLLNSQIKPLNESWNYEVSALNTKPLSLNDENIIHYLGSRKPWAYPELEYCYLWWNYARKTPFYETILKQLMEQSIFESLLVTQNLHKYQLKYLKYIILSKITFGKQKKHYLYKKDMWKNRINSSSNIRGKIKW